MQSPLAEEPPRARGAGKFVCEEGCSNVISSFSRYIDTARFHAGRVYPCFNASWRRLEDVHHRDFPLVTERLVNAVHPFDIAAQMFWTRIASPIRRRECATRLSAVAIW